jgi:hypothetical protein
MRWWVIAFVVLAILWWLGHRHLNRRLAKLRAAGAKAPCGCSNASSTGTVGSSISSSVGNGTSQTSGGGQFSPSPIGTLPSTVGDGGPNALPKWNPNGGIWQ